jgi:hypothetical protein
MVAAPAPVKEPTADPIAAAATGSAVGAVVQSAAGKSGRSSEVPAHRSGAGGGMAGPGSLRFSAQRVWQRQLGAVLETGMTSSLS